MSGDVVEWQSGEEKDIENLSPEERHAWACQELIKMRGKIDLKIDLAALRNDD